MASRIDGEIYYRTSEVCQRAGISKATLFRWLSEGILEDVLHKDRRGWRLFTKDDVSRMKKEAGNSASYIRNCCLTR